MTGRIAGMALALSLGLAAAGLAVAPATAGDVQLAAGKKHPGANLFLRNTCIACHGKDGKKAIMDYPNLAGQDEKYMIEQVNDIMSGKRVGSPDQTGNPSAQAMRGALMTPEGEPRINEKQIKAISEWLASLEPAPANQDADPAKVKEGATLYKKLKCITCHGPEGKRPLKGYPYIAGQKKAYLMAQVKDIRDGNRTNGKAKLMANTTKRVTDEQIEIVATYLSQVDRTK